MKGFGIEIKNDLLDPKHVDKMGIAVWLYMWCIDKMTGISEYGIGVVLGGKPIVYDEVAIDLGITSRTYSRWISTLSAGGYISTERTPHGLRISVNKAFKRFGKRTNKTGRPCEWCDRTMFALVAHHYPIPQEDGGTETVLICVVCHAIYHSTELPPENPIYRNFGDTTKVSYAKKDVSIGQKRLIDSTKMSDVLLTNTVDNTVDKTVSGVSFEDFWKAYPRKVEKKKTEQKWRGVSKKDRELIMRDIPERMKTDSWRRGFIPHPTTYLNGERWNDEIVLTSGEHSRLAPTVHTA